MQLPKEVQSIITTLREANYQAYAVGGCARDILLHRPPHDWDITTDAKPEEIQQLFPKNFYANKFGTVTVLTDSTNKTLREIEVTTYRIDADYTDQRHPDKVSFTTKIAEDLARRDFTINAIAMDDKEIIDPFHGQEDLANKIIRAVGKPAERFTEDALRLMRAVRLAAQLDFAIEETTLAAIKKLAKEIGMVSQERVRDELVKIVMSSNPAKGINLLNETGLLPIILPEIAEGIDVTQNKHHIYTVYDHNVKSLQFAAQYKYPLEIRLAALLHDVGKPRTKRP